MSLNLNYAVSRNPHIKYQRVCKGCPFSFATKKNPTTTQRTMLLEWEPEWNYELQYSVTRKTPFERCIQLHTPSLFYFLHTVILILLGTQKRISRSSTLLKGKCTRIRNILALCFFYLLHTQLYIQFYSFPCLCSGVVRSSGFSNIRDFGKSLFAGLHLFFRRQDIFL